MHLAPVVDQGVAQHHALRQEEGEAGTLVHQHKETEFLAQLAVVALFRLLDALEIGVQLVLLREGDAVNALEALAARVAAPVGGVAGGELQGVALHAAGGVQMRTGAEVDELALAVKADGLALRQVVDELDLEGIVLHKLQCLGTRQLKALDLELFLADLAHLLLDLREVKAKGA